MRYTSAITKWVTNHEKPEPTNLMKTNMIHVITITVLSALIVGLGGMEVTGSVLTGATVGLSYLAVAVLVAIAASDYRSGPKPYYSATVITGDFQGAGPVSRAARTPSVKARVAA